MGGSKGALPNSDSSILMCLFWDVPVSTRIRNQKDPSVLKIARRANSLRRGKTATAIAKRYGTEVLVFLGPRKRKQENGTDSKTLRR